MLIRLQEMGHVQHFRNDVPEGKKPQPNALALGTANPEVMDSQWILIIDADEFLNVRIGDHRVDDLIAAIETADAVLINWRMMGSCGRARMEPGLVTQRFQRGSSHENPANGLVWSFRCLFRPERFDYFNVHRPKFDEKLRSPAPELAKWVNCSFEDVGERVYRKGWRSNADTVSYGFGQINHCAVKSREEFFLKRLRGTANSKNAGRIDMVVIFWKQYGATAHISPNY